MAKSDKASEVKSDKMTEGASSNVHGSKKRRPNGAPWYGKFLDTLGERANVWEACQAVGISRRTAFNYKTDDEDFCESWLDACDDAKDKAELELWKRAFDASNRSPAYLIFLLKALMPEKFRDNFDWGKFMQELSAKGGGLTAAVQMASKLPANQTPPALDVECVEVGPTT